MKIVSLINGSAKRTHRLKNQQFFLFKTNGRKCDFECPIHGIINSGKIEGCSLAGYVPFIDLNSYIMTFSESLF